jgi:hypothetical protein
MVGGVDSWPTYIAMDMFVVEPNARVMKIVAGFMFGNEVTLDKAEDCYIACRRQQYSREIKEALYSWYDTWDTHTRNRRNVDCRIYAFETSVVVEREGIGPRRDSEDRGGGAGDWSGADQKDLSRMVVGVKLCHRVES